MLDAEEEVSEEDSELALEMLMMLTAGLDMVLEMTGAGGKGNIVVVVVTAGDTERTGGGGGLLVLHCTLHRGQTCTQWLCLD